MEVRSEALQFRCDKLTAPVIQRTRLRVWFIRVCSSILLWTCIVQLVAVGELWHPQMLTGISNRMTWLTPYPLRVEEAVHFPPPLVPASEFLFVICSWKRREVLDLLSTMTVMEPFCKISM